MIHHVIPKHEWKQRFGNLEGCNSPDNRVELTTEQHAQAHQFLYELFGNEYDRIAFLAISTEIGKEEAIRRAGIVANMGRKDSIETVKKRAERIKGKPRPEKVRLAISLGMIGNKNAEGNKNNLGRIPSQKQNKKHSEFMKQFHSNRRKGEQK